MSKQFDDQFPRFNNSGIPINVSSTPFDVLKNFLDAATVNEIVRQTNMCDYFYF